MFETVEKNLLRIREEIEPWQPKIIAVTKYYNETAIIDAYKAGLRNFGESRCIEACKKINSLPNEIKENSKFHFIGHLQTNKVKQAVEVFDYIHSVDSVKLAEVISQSAQSQNKVQKVLLQVNNACEEQKFGFSKVEIIENFPLLKNLANIEIVGLMNMTPLGASEDLSHTLFSELRELRDILEQKYDCKLEELSMGMSQDYLIASQEGATMLRIGRKLFT